MTGSDQQVGQVLTIHVHISQDPEVLAMVHTPQLNDICSDRMAHSGNVWDKKEMVAEYWIRISKYQKPIGIIMSYHH